MMPQSVRPQSLVLGGFECCTNYASTTPCPESSAHLMTVLPNIRRAFFKNHGIGIVGFWTAVIGTGNQLTYILSFDDMADREDKWGAFQNNSDWHKVRADSERDGTLVASVRTALCG